MATVSHARNVPHVGSRAAGSIHDQKDGPLHTYRLPPGVATLKFGDARASSPHPSKDIHLPAIHVVPGVLGPVPAGQSRFSLLRPKIPVYLTAQDVESLIQEQGQASTTANLSQRDIDILVANGALPPSRQSTLYSHPISPRTASNARLSDSSANILDEDWPYPYPPVPATSGPFRMPTISRPIQQQNARLTTLLALLNRAYGAGGGDYAGRGGGNGRGRRDDHHALYGFEGEDSHAGFEKNLSDIQKLMERAKNFDDKGYNTTGLPPGETDKAGKRRKAEKSSISQHHQQTQLFDLLSENKALAGRKPIRVIAADLEKRIETLKTNQAEWDAFQNKISEYRAADLQRARTAPADMVRQNKQALMELQPGYRRQRIVSAKEQRAQHHAEIIARKKEQDMELWHKKVAALQKKEDVVELLKKKEKEQLGRAEALQKKWFILAAVASRMTIIRIVLETERQRRADSLVRLHAARLIQGTYRAYIRKKAEAGKLMAMAKIAVVFHKYVIRRRELQKHLASDAIRQFFRDVYDVSRLMKIVKKYRFSVVKAQTYVLSWHAIRNAQVDVVCKYWDKLEPLWWNQRKGGGAASMAAAASASNAELEEKKDKTKSKKTRGKSRKDEHGDKILLKTTTVIKQKVVIEDLIKRRKEHRLRLAQFEQDLSTFNASHKSGKGETGPPRRPVFKLLPPQHDMLVLMEKGFLEAASAGWR